MSHQRPIPISHEAETAAAMGLANVYEAWGKPDKAAENRALAHKP